MSIQVGAESGIDHVARAPHELRRYLLPFAWDREKLDGLGLRTERLAAAELTWWLDEPVWECGGIPFSLRPRDVMRGSRDYPDHLRSVSRADLEQPIYITRIDDRWSVLDGTARLAKAVAFGLPTVPVRKVPPSALDQLRIS